MISLICGIHKKIKKHENRLIEKKLVITGGYWEGGRGNIGIEDKNYKL